MHFQWQIASLLVAASIEIAIAFVVRARSRAFARDPFLLGLLMGAVWALNYALDLSTDSYAAKLLLLRLRFTFLPFYPLLWSETAYRFARGRKMFGGWRLAAGLTVPVVTAVLAWLPVSIAPLALLRPNLRLDLAGNLSVLRFAFGPWALVFGAFCLTMFAIAVLTLIWYRGESHWDRAGRWLFLGAFGFGLVLNALQALNLSPTPGINYAPIFAPFTFGLVAVALIRGRLLDLAPVARTALIENLDELLIVIDADQRVVDLNRAACVAFGTTPEKVWGEPVETLLGQWPAVANRLRSGGPDCSEVRRGDGVFELRLLPVIDRRQRTQARILVLRDITARKRDEEALRRAKEAAEAGNEAKSRFLATMSHEIHTPMNGVLGFTQILRTTHLDAEQREYVNLIEQSGHALLLIIDDILDYATITAGHPAFETVPCYVAVVVGQACEAVRLRATEKGLTLHWIIAPEVPARIVSVPQRLGQILAKLLDNAVKFTERGGIEVRVACRRRPADPAGRDRCTLEFAVSDTGIGIAAEMLERIFQPFAQADTSNTRRFGGTGLGLPIARRLCELLGGGLTVASQPGQGATFVARIETVAAVPEAVEVAATELRAG